MNIKQRKLFEEMLIRAALLKIEEDDYALVVNIHHILIDGWSKGIMLREMLALYEAFSQGKPSPLSELPLQYTDYVHWHHEWMRGEVFARQLSYWKERLAGAPPVLALPFDRPRPGIPSGKGSLHMIQLVFETVDAIPLNANGKVDIDALPVPSWDRPELDVDYKAPQTEIEKTIAALWQELLHLERIGINDNFFDLGGHSLLLTRVHNRLNERVQIKKELTIVDLFRYPTIHSLAKYIEKDENQQQSKENYQKIRDRAAKQRQAFSRKPVKLRSKMSLKEEVKWRQC